MTPQEAIRTILAKAEYQTIDTTAIADELEPAWARGRVSREIPYPEGFERIYSILPYMLERGITLEDAQAVNLGWCRKGRYAGRLVFPVFEQGSLVYYQARAMWPPTPGRKHIKMLNPPAVNGQSVSSDFLFNLEQAAQYPRVAITEGPIDAVKVGVDAVCTFGKRITDTQVGKLLGAGVTAVDLMWDGPSPTEPFGAWPEMIRAAKRLSGVFDVRLVFLPQGDPGDYPREQLRWYREQAGRLTSRWAQIG
jgi:hypothetical protein